jgi:primosomal protein N' (replication factor Y)
MIVLGPTAANVPKVNQKYRYRILIKTKNTSLFRKYMSEALTEFYENSDKSVSVFVDINPESVI